MQDFNVVVSSQSFKVPPYSSVSFSVPLFFTYFGTLIKSLLKAG